MNEATEGRIEQKPQDTRTIDNFFGEELSRVQKTFIIKVDAAA
jgi:hypothetical protein